MRRINVIFVLAVLLLASVSFAAPQSKKSVAIKSGKQVTVTLVRWPYT
jgi:hypothetical protein